MFQFLIGRLKTKHIRQALAYLVEFQFLIGRLKTAIEQIEQADGKGFQFLIGRLKTRGSADLPKQPQLVSIPHR